MLAGIYHYVDPLTAVLYPIYTEPCEVCGSPMVTTPRERLKRHAAAASAPLATFAHELESDYVGQFEKLISESIIDRVQRYRDVLDHVAAGDLTAAGLSTDERTWCEREAQRAREFSALAVRYYQSNLDLQSEYARDLLTQLAADVETSDDQPRARKAPTKRTAASHKAAPAEVSSAEHSGGGSRSRSSAKKPAESTE